MQSTLLKITEVSQKYEIPEATLRYWRHKGEGPPSARIGRRVMYRQSDVEAWISNQFASQSGAA